MVKPLQFKGEKKPRKRKAPDADADGIKSSNDASNSLAVPKLSELNREDDSWVTAEAPADIIGPIIFALPSAQPSCIACDANGKVFASEIENIVDADLATAEPHDVRQVWVACRIAGTENISFKGHHGGSGVLSASHEAISPEESFRCIPTPDSAGMFSILTEREQFITITEDSKLRGNAESMSFNTTLRIRMQARFKPKLKANKESKAQEKISRKELEEVVGRRLEDDEVRILKKARIQGDYHEAILNVRVKGKHDKYS
ncbi:hypothetical protein MMC07_004159 [Pseudocyphellaria aurata]|nr:hypothetical protein [Pseudocyphellaria aurata]